MGFMVDQQSGVNGGCILHSNGSWMVDSFGFRMVVVAGDCYRK